MGTYLGVWWWERGGGGTCPGHYMYWFLAAATGLDDAATV